MESTLQLVYDVLHLSLFFKAFLVTTDVLKIYMQEFWATATVHHHSIRFKMDDKKHIVNLKSFREMLHICPRLLHQPFVEPPFEEEILAFLRFLGHSGVIRKLTDVNINKLHHLWRSFADIINKCLIEKSSGYDSLRLSQAQILWGLYHKRNVDFAYLMRNKVKWHYVRDDHMFTTITLVSRHQNTQQFGLRLTTSEKGKQAAKASKAKSLSALSKVAMTMAQQMKLATKRSLQQTHISQVSGSGADKGTSFIPGVPDVPTNESEEEETRGEESFDPILKTPKNTDDEGNGEENLGTNVGREEGHDEEDEANELYKDININLGRGIQLGDVHTTQKVKDSHVTLTPTLEANFSEFMQTNQFGGAVSAILGIIHRYMDQWMNEAVQVAV
nr:hypothetical protein [Tanacetum cinerariifolium]